MKTSPGTRTDLRGSSAQDHGIVYVGIADAVFLLLALWLALASLTPAQPLTRPEDTTPSVTLKAEPSGSKGPPHPDHGGDSKAEPNYRLEGQLVPIDGPSRTDGAIVLEVPTDVFEILQKASSARVISYR